MKFKIIIHARTLSRGENFLYYYALFALNENKNERIILVEICKGAPVSLRYKSKAMLL